MALLGVLPGLGATATGAATTPTSYYIALGASLVTGAGSTGGADYVNDLGTTLRRAFPASKSSTWAAGGRRPRNDRRRALPSTPLAANSVTPSVFAGSPRSGIVHHDRHRCRRCPRMRIGGDHQRVLL